MGLTNAECLDFDFSVRSLKRWADRRSDEVDYVADMSKPSKHRQKAVPRYGNLMAVLGIDELDQEPIATEDVTRLVDQMMTGTQAWQPIAWPE
jgi:hypothetical protein